MKTHIQKVLKNILALAITLTLVISVIAMDSAQAAQTPNGVIKSSNGFYYCYKNGSKVKKSGWVTVNGNLKVKLTNSYKVQYKQIKKGSKTYVSKYVASKKKFVNLDRTVITLSDKKLHFVSKGGILVRKQTTVKDSNGNVYHLGKGGIVTTKYVSKTKSLYKYDYKHSRWIIVKRTISKANGNSIYYDANGKIKDGLYKDSDKYYRVYKSGKKVQKSGWITVNNKIKVKLNSKSVACYKQERKGGKDYISKYDTIKRDFYPLERVPIMLSDGKLHAVGDKGLLCTKKTAFLSQGCDICVTDGKGIFLKKFITAKNFNDGRENTKDDNVLYENVNGKLVKVRSRVETLEVKINLKKDSNLYFFDRNGHICRGEGWYTDTDGNKIEVGKSERVVRKYVAKTKQLYKYNYKKYKWVKETGVSKCNIDGKMYYFDKTGRMTKIVALAATQHVHDWEVWDQETEVHSFCNTCGADITGISTKEHCEASGTHWTKFGDMLIEVTNCAGASHGGDVVVSTTWVCYDCGKKVTTNGESRP